jgi:hypothetical protein
MRYKYLFIIKNKYSFAAVRFHCKSTTMEIFLPSPVEDVMRDKTLFSGAVVYRNS